LPALLNIQTIGKCFLVLPGNKTPDPEVKIHGTVPSSSVAIF
jgi:hypothetical protein